MARIAMIIKQPGFLRYIQTQVERLCVEGHHVHIGVHDYPINDEDGLLENLCHRFPHVSVGWAYSRGDRWAHLAGIIRGAMDYCHYLFPDFISSLGLRQRARAHAGLPGRMLSKLLRNLKVDRSNVAAKLVMDILRNVERALPPDPTIMTYIRQLDVDLVLLTGLVWPRSPQADYVKVCRRLGIKTGYIVNSWDNLTNKGDIKALPDRVFVWNDHQAKEAIQFHGMSPSNVVVTGAPLFDRWFRREPSMSREEFCKHVGLADTRPYLLYACSSPTIAPGQSERIFFQEWLTALRDSTHPLLTDIQVLVRPHPFNPTAWEDFHSDDPGVTVFPRGGGWVVKEEDRDAYYNSLYYCAAVVGINTSAMLESAIVGARTFTLQTKDFATMQEGTVHFRYLTALGIVESHTDFISHFDAIARVVSNNDADTRQPISGVIHFVRPHGIDQPATDVAFHAIEELLGQQGRIQKEILPVLTWRSILFLSLLSSRLFLDLSRRFQTKLLPKLLALGLDSLPQETDPLQVLVLRDRRCQRRIAYVRSNLKSAVKGEEPIIVGPWLSEVGFEVLYWIPFLYWVRKHYRLKPDRLYVISRGGAQHWYGDLSHRYIDVFDMYSPDEFKRLNGARCLELGHQKQSTRTEWEERICREASARWGLKHYKNLHPSVMFRLFAHYWKDIGGVEFINTFTRYKPIRLNNNFMTGIRKHLPDRYVAVKFYYRESLPDNPGNRAFIEKTIRTLSRHIDVVLLGTGFQVDDHTDFLMKDGGRIHRIDRFMTPSNNLTIQTEVLAGASLFVGTYGGVTYVANYLGVPAICFESKAELNLAVHTQLAMRKLRSFGGGFHLLNVSDVKLFQWLLAHQYQSNNHESVILTPSETCAGNL